MTNLSIYPLADEVKPLKEPSTIGGTLVLEEKVRLLKVAGERPEGIKIIQDGPELALAS